MREVNQVVETVLDTEVYPECQIWNEKFFKEIQSNGIHSIEQALGICTENLRAPVSCKIEIIHRKFFHSPEDLKIAIGAGDWFWRWKQIPDRVGSMVGYSSPMVAAIEGLHVEAKFKANMISQGMTAEQWGAWYPGQKWRKPEEQAEQ